MYIFLLTTCFVGILLPSFLSLLELVNNGIPLWFRCFKGNNDPNAFSLSLINQGISFVHDLFKDKNCKLIFLADRWFNFREIMQHIESLSCTYCIRTKTNVAIEIDNYEYSDMIAEQREMIIKYQEDLENYKEISRILLRENLDLKDYLKENNMLDSENLVNLNDLYSCFNGEDKDLDETIDESLEVIEDDNSRKVS